MAFTDVKRRTFTLEFECENDAFQDGDESREIARILRHIAQIIETQGAPAHHQTVFDMHGNGIGRYDVKEI